MFGLDFDNLESFGMMMVLAIVITLLVTIVLAIAVVPDKKREKLKGFARALNDVFNFRGLLIESIVRFLYLLTTVAFVVGGIFMLFLKNPYSDDWYGWIGIIVMVVGPIVTRLIFESAMLFILLVKNAIQINNKLKDQTKGEAVPVLQINAPQPVVNPVYTKPTAPVANTPVTPPDAKATEVPVAKAPEAPAEEKAEAKSEAKAENETQA